MLIDSEHESWQHQRAIPREDIQLALHSYDVGSHQELLSVLQLETNLAHAKPSQSKIDRGILTEPSKAELIYFEIMMKNLCIKHDALLPDDLPIEIFDTYEGMDRAQIVGDIARRSRGIVRNGEQSGRYLDVPQEDDQDLPQMQIAKLESNTPGGDPTIRIDYFEEMFDQDVIIDGKASDGYLLYRCYKIAPDGELYVHQNDVDINDYIQLIKHHEGSEDELFTQLQLRDELALQGYSGNTILFEEASTQESYELLQSLRRIQNR